MTFHMGMSWHAGERKIQSLMGGPGTDNPTVPLLSQQAARMLQVAPLLAIGTVDLEGRPWTTLWGGNPPLAQPLGNSIIGMRTMVDRSHDPVVEILFGSNADGEVVKEKGVGRMVGGLAIDLETRKRVKLYGRMVAGAVSSAHVGDCDEPDNGEQEGEAAQEAHQIQLVCRIEQSLGNCPKYLNKKHITPVTVTSALISDSADLSQEALDHIRRSDLFFVSSVHDITDMDTNHRGGAPGFVRCKRSTESGQWTVYWPEYSGNRLYQTLGNLMETPLAGLVFPDFVSGDVLYVTGRTEVLSGKEAAAVLPRSNLVVALTIDAARHIRQGLPFRGTPGEQSPYNPRIRPLVDEASILVPTADTVMSKSNTAKLLSKEEITPTINKYTLSLSNSGSWTPGQWVALDFSNELDMGYSHMRDDDPTSLNDDFIRTFTVSSAPPPYGIQGEGQETVHTFEMTVRTVGAVTLALSRQKADDRVPFEVPIRGFGGDVRIKPSSSTLDDNNGKIVPVVAGGVGITPVMAQLHELDLEKLIVFWTVSIDDVALVLHVLENFPQAVACFHVFITGSSASQEGSPGQMTRKENLQKLRDILGEEKIHMRRLQRDDLVDLDSGSSSKLSNRWHVCVSTRLRKSLAEWLEGKEIVFEDFNF